MRINLIDESFKECMRDGRSEGLIIPAASFYVNREGLRNKNAADIGTSTGWYFRDILKIDAPDRFMQELFKFSSKTGSSGKVSLQGKIANSFGVSNFYTYNSHQGPFESGMINSATGDPITCICNHIEKMASDIFTQYNMPNELAIGPLFWDPMYRIGDVTREKAIDLMMAELNKYELDHTFNVYSKL